MMLVCYNINNSGIGQVSALGDVAFKGLVEEVLLGLPWLYYLYFSGIGCLSLLLSLLPNWKQLSKLHFYFRFGRILRC